MNREDARHLTSRMVGLAAQGYVCSQIFLLLSLENEGAGEKNPDLVRAMAGLGNGCGTTRETCGILTGASCLLAYHVKDQEELSVLLQEMGDWFQDVVEREFGGTRCEEIVGDKLGTPAGKRICGRLLFRTYVMAKEILY